MAQRDKVQINNSMTVFPRGTYSGLSERKLDIKNGARIVFSFYVFSKDPGANVTAKVFTSFSEDMPFCEVLTVPAKPLGEHTKFVLSDFHNFIDLQLEVAGGSAEVIFGLNVFDNALTTRIENAEISVDTNHQIQPNGSYDSMRIGDGEYELDILPDGSIKVNIVNTSVVPEVVKPIFDEVTNVPKELRTLVASHVTDVNKETYLQHVSVSGDNTAVYEVEIGGNVIDKRRTYFGGGLSEDFIFKAYSENGILVPPNTAIRTYVTHHRPFIGSFSSRIQILEIG